MGMIEGCGKGKCTGMCERSNTCPGYSDEEVKEALLPASKSYLSVQERGFIQRWAAEQYLKAKEVIEWYGDKNNQKHILVSRDAHPGICAEPSSEYIEDFGQRAREFLNNK